MLSSKVPSKAAWRDVFFTRCGGKQRSELVEGTSLYDAACQRNHGYPNGPR
jgi:hypothetical protein